MASLTGPHGYAQARREANANYSSPSSSPPSFFVRTVENRPYFPLLRVDPADEVSVLNVARSIVSFDRDAFTEDGDNAGRLDGQKGGKATLVTGGLTNALFKVDLTMPTKTVSATTTTSLLVRVFGADGMIDRDLETTNFARLCNHRHLTSRGVVHAQLDVVGRFANGRVETWVPGMRMAHHTRDFGREGLAIEVARQLARLHHGFDADVADDADVDADVDAFAGGSATITATEKRRGRRRPTLWGVIRSWIEELSQQLAHDRFRGDACLVELFSLAIGTSRRHGHDGDENSSSSESSPATSVADIISSLSGELSWLKNRVETRFPHAPIAFCHNDVNASNILLDVGTDAEHDGNKGEGNANKDGEMEGGDKGRKTFNEDTVCIIDYEYSSFNYAMYDVANFTCEHCGGNDNGMPNYELLPDRGWLERFLRAYIQACDEIALSAKGSEETDEELSDLCSQVESFQMASNLYWGIWGILQAAGEVIADNDGRKFQAECARRRVAGDLDPDKWDYLRYGKNRLERYWICKERILPCINGNGDSS